ncbi:hypothetical protein RJ640_013656 [Escallonia rubra]|uniref:Rapid ALkalinization Factor n=1 Tax=Escallonia rubra TaxID=112253 RepID=A0AA88UKU8_9ASTE|nr:hypothetical protein RJ640_013656 [Escallonia rubra]
MATFRSMLLFSLMTLSVYSLLMSKTNADMEISFGAGGRSECDSRHPQFCVDHNPLSKFHWKCEDGKNCELGQNNPAEAEPSGDDNEDDGINHDDDNRDKGFDEAGEIDPAERQSEEASSLFTSVTQKKSEVNILNSSEMAMIRLAMVLCLRALIMSLLVTEVAAIRYIGYPAMSLDGNYHCSRKSEKCHPQPANPYNRGCEAAQRCRRDLEAKVSDNKNDEGENISGRNSKAESRGFGDIARKNGLE